MNFPVNLGFFYIFLGVLWTEIPIHVDNLQLRRAWNKLENYLFHKLLTDFTFFFPRNSPIFSLKNAKKNLKGCKLETPLNTCLVLEVGAVSAIFSYHALWSLILEILSVNVRWFMPTSTRYLFNYWCAAF